MTQARYPTEERIAQIVEAIKAGKRTTHELADAVGIKTASRMSLVLNAGIESGAFVRTFVRVSETMRTPEFVYFLTASERDAFRAEYDRAAKERARQANVVKMQRRRDRRNRAPEIAARAAKRAILRAEREQQRAQEAAERAARGELGKQRARLDKEAAAAERQRQKAAAESHKARLRAETKELGMLAKLKGTKTPKAEAKPCGPARLPGALVYDEAQVKRYPTPPGRFAVTEAPSVISSRECRPWAQVAAA